MVKLTTWSCVYRMFYISVSVLWFNRDNVQATTENQVSAQHIFLEIYRIIVLIILININIDLFDLPHHYI